jgi:ribosomal protein S27AE
MTTSWQCGTCGSTEVEHKVKEWIESVVAEESYRCLKCGENAYWAYGHYVDHHMPFKVIIQD